MPHPKVKLSDDSGNAVSVTGNRLDVNAYLAATPTIDIGDVSIKSGDGTAITDTVSGRLDVTLDVKSGVHIEDVAHSTGDAGMMILAVRSDVIGTLSGADGDYTPLQVSATGNLYTVDRFTSDIKSSLAIMDDTISGQNGAVTSKGTTIMYEAKNIDGSGLPNDVDEGDAIRPACSTAGIQYTHLTDVQGRGSAIVIDDAAQSADPPMLNVGGEYRATPTVYADGDATIFLTTQNGALQVGGTVLDNIATKLTTVDNIVHVDDAAFTLGSHSGVMMMGFAGTQSVNANDACALACDTDGALHISGTVELGSTDNAVLDAMVVDLAAMEALLITIDADTNAIKTAVEILDDWDDSNYANVNVNLAGADAPTGGGTESGALRVTIANDSTGVLTVDGTVTANLGTTDNAVLDAIAASLALLDNSIASGNELQVDIVGSLPAGSAAIGKLAANSGVDIGDVDITSTVHPGGFSAVAQFTTNIGASATQLDTQACKHADIMAKVGNAGIIYVGGSSVAATTGIALYPGDVYSVDVANTNLLYGIAISANDDLQVVYYN